MNMAILSYQYCYYLFYREIHKMILIIAIPETLRSGPGQRLTLVGYSSVLPKIIRSHVIYIFVTITLNRMSQPPIGLCISVFTVCRWSKIVRFWINLSAAKHLFEKISRALVWNLWENQTFKMDWIKYIYIIPYLM